MCREAVRLGVLGFDLIAPQDWPTLHAHGLVPICTGPGQGVDFLTGVVHAEAHDSMVEPYYANIDLCAEGGCGRILINAGQLRGLTYAQAADNAVALLKRITDRLVERGVILALENDNDRRPNDPDLGRQDMAFGHWAWGVDVVQRVNHPNVKLTCDLYHMQIMDGDLAYNIRETAEWITHFNVAGVPTRRELDATQEVNWRYIAEVIADLDGYDGYVSHEWRPTPGRDPLASVAEAIAIMDV
jgi:hydroxypyruvate isomerase